MIQVVRVVTVEVAQVNTEQNIALPSLFGLNVARCFRRKWTLPVPVLLEGQDGSNIRGFRGFIASPFSMTYIPLTGQGSVCDVHRTSGHDRVGWFAFLIVWDRIDIRSLNVVTASPQLFKL